MEDRSWRTFSSRPCAALLRIHTQHRAIRSNALLPMWDQRSHLKKRSLLTASLQSAGGCLLSEDIPSGEPKPARAQLLSTFEKFRARCTEKCTSCVRRQDDAGRCSASAVGSSCLVVHAIALILCARQCTCSAAGHDWPRSLPTTQQVCCSWYEHEQGFGNAGGSGSSEPYGRARHCYMSWDLTLRISCRAGLTRSSRLRRRLAHPRCPPAPRP